MPLSPVSANGGGVIVHLSGVSMREKDRVGVSNAQLVSPGPFQFFLLHSLFSLISAPCIFSAALIC